MILTKELIEKGRSINNGFSIKQVNLLGIENLKNKWINKVINKDFPEYIIREFIELKNKHLPVETIFPSYMLNSPLKEGKYKGYLIKDIIKIIPKYYKELRLNFHHECGNYYNELYKEKKPSVFIIKK